MMRLRKTTFVILVLVWVLARPGIRGWRSLAQLLRPGQWSDGLREETHSDTAFVVDDNDFVTLELPPTWQRLRILTNATLLRDQVVQMPDDSESPEQHYSLEYQFLNESGEVLLNDDYHFRTRMIRYRDSESDEVSYSTFFADPNYLPAATQSMIWSRDSIFTGATRVRLRLKQADTGIVDVVARAFSQAVVPDYRTTLMWQRMAPHERTRLARANIYSPKLLAKTEILDLMRSNWSALLPRGIRGLDYRYRTLYTLKEFEGEEIHKPEIAAGIPVSNQIRAMLPLPDEAGQLRLLVQPAEHLAGKESNPMVMHWHRPGRQHRQTHRFLATGPSNLFELDVEGGLIEVESQHNVVVQAFWIPITTTTEPVPQDITPQPVYLRTYRVDAESPLDFLVSHVRQRPTPFRVDMRTLVTSRREDTAEDQVADGAVMQWELSDSNGQCLRRGQVPVQPTISLYDRTSDGTDVKQVSDPVSFYFALEPAARRLRFRAIEGSALLACYTRPPDVAKVTHVPEDYSAYHRSHSSNRTWFITRPVQHHQCLADGRLASLVVQTRPPKTDDELLAGRYQWRDYHPLGSWSARQLLVPRQTSVPFRLVAASTTYCELEANRDYVLTLADRPERTHIAPRVIFEIPAPPQTLRFYVDGRLHDTHALHSVRGEIALLPIDQSQSPRTRHIRIETSAPAKLLLNHVHPESLPSFQKRLAARLRDSALVFSYDKLTSQSELLLMRYFRASQTANRLKVQIHGEISPAAGRTRSWTHTQRFFELRPTDSRTGVVVNDAKQTVDEGQLIFLPLGDDLPAGTYTIEVESLDGDEGYLMLYQTTPGTPEQPEVFTERHLDVDRANPL